jgi:hypothetical protein
MLGLSAIALFFGVLIFVHKYIENQEDKNVEIDRIQKIDLSHIIDTLFTW